VNPTRIGTVTIGQTPRDDVLVEIKSLISTNIEIVEKGALDTLTVEEIADLRPAKDDEILITRMSDGTELTVGRDHILPRMQDAISELDRDKDVALITLLCSGEFPVFECSKPLITPFRLFWGALASISIEGSLGMMLPSREQVKTTVETFEGLGCKVVGVGASPYGKEEEIVRVAKELKGRVDLVFMNCFGYSLEMKRIVRQITGKPVILARSLLARTLDELLHGYCE
jgi:protein AroM